MCKLQSRGATGEAKPDPGLIPAAPLFSGDLSGAGEEGERGIDRRLSILA